jgi:hypothetical protein
VISLLIALGPRRPNCRPARQVKHPKLQPGVIGYPPHFSAHSVKLADYLAFRKAADSRVARHSGDSVYVHGYKQSIEAKTRKRERGFTARVPRANNNRIIVLQNEYTFDKYLTGLRDKFG